MHFFAACATIDAFDAFDTLSAGFSRTHCPCQLAGLILVRPTPFGLPRTPNPKGTFVRFCATKLLFFQGVHVCTAWKNSSFRTVLRHKKLFLQGLYQYRPWRNSFCTFFFARFAHASSFDWFAQPVGFPSTPNPKGAEQAPGIPP